MTPRASEPATILIVDDTLDNLRLLAGILKEHGYASRLLRDGRMVMASVLQSPPDVILLDIMMPDLDGYGVCAQLKADERARDIPVIFLSALNDTVDKLKAFAAGGVDYITKPFHVDEVLARVNTHLTLRRAQQQLEARNLELQREILRRQQAEESFAEEQHLLRTLIDLLPDYIFVKDSARRFILNNIAHLRVLGATAQDDVFGETDADRFPPELAAQYAADEDHIMQSGEALVNHEETTLTPTGEWQCLATTKVPLRNRQGAIIGLVGISHDMTERKRLEDALRDLNASKDKFFSIIAHDLRSPFTALIGLTQLMLENFERYSPAQFKAKLEKLYTSAERVFALLENLLTWSRIQRGAMEYAPEPLDVQYIVKDTIDIFLTSAERKQIAFRCAIPPGLQVWADHQMVTTILRNLISNALKFTPAQGRIRIEARAAGALVEIAVADSGVGMAADVLDKLFRLDAHLTTAGTDGERGTGLGLLLCQDLAQKQGGTIRVASAIGAGATFTVTLPVPPAGA